MSTSTSQEDDGPADSMVDEAELARPKSHAHTLEPDSSDEETVKGDPDQGHIAELPGNESPPAEPQIAAPAPRSAIAQRYRQLLEADRESTSEEGSADAVPRIAISPSGSCQDIPDDTPSIQVFGPGNSVQAHSGAWIC